MSHGQTGGDKEAERMALVAHAGPAEGVHGEHADHGDHGHEEHEHIHMPPPSYWPIVLAFFISVTFAGFLSTLVITGIGALCCLFCMIMWGREQSQAYTRALTNVRVVGEGDAEEKLAAGARIVSRDGKFVGRITQATEDSPTVRQGWVPTRYGYMPRSTIDHIEDSAIVLNLTEAEIRARGNVDITPAGPGNTQIAPPTARAALRSGTTRQ